MTQIISIAQRHKYILDKLKKDGYIRVADIAKSLKVTAVTVRKDFKALEEQGLLFRTHGSACPVNPHVADRSVQLKELENRVQKEKIVDKKVRIGVIGCGGIANGKHMPAEKRNPNAEMVAFCDIVEERAVKAREDFGTPECAVYTDYRELLKDKDILMVKTL